MNIIKKYMDIYKDDRVVVIGGYATYIFIKKYMDVSIPISDIDVHIHTSEKEDVIIDRWLSILDGYSTSHVSSITTLTKDGDIPYDIFINENGTLDVVDVDGVYVEHPQSLIEGHEISLDGMKQDLDYIGLTQGEKDYLTPKIERYEHRLPLLRELPLLEKKAIP